MFTVYGDTDVPSVWNENMRKKENWLLPSKNENIKECEGKVA